MDKVLLAVGKFKFFIGKSSYDEIRRRIDFEWSVLPRLKRRPLLMFDGVGTETLSLNGETYRDAVGGDPRFIFDEVKAIALNGTPEVVVDGEGNYLGLCAIKSLEVTGYSIAEDSQPRMAKFTIELLFYE